MTFLPIVERELRVAARRRGTFRSRWLMASGALLLGGIIMGWCNYFSPLGLRSQSEMGQYIFWGLALLSQLYCLCVGRFSTAECLVVEKQQGTLGLLFLTELRGYDVVLGKLAATSVPAFYGLLAVFPALAVPLLMGGVTNGEFWRVVFALVITFLFSLATGIFSSALAQSYEQAMAWNFYLMLLFVVGPFVFYLGVITFSGDVEKFLPLFVPCPVFTLVVGNDADYGRIPWYYWISAGLFLGLTFGFIWWAGKIISAAFREDSAVIEPSSRRVTSVVKPGKSLVRGTSLSGAAFRKRCLDLNAIHWLTSRPGNKSTHVWIFMVFAGFWWLIMGFLMGRQWISRESTVASVIILNVSFKLWVTLEAGAWLARDRKSGALELLLPTPLTVPDMIRGQLQSIRRQFLAPLVVAVVVEMILAVACGEPAASDGWLRVWNCGKAVFMLLADLGALTGAAMLDALTAKNPARAPIKTVLRLLVLPWIVVVVVVAGGIFLVRNDRWPRWQPTWDFILAVWLLAGLVADSFFGFRAWWRLSAKFRELAAGRALTGTESAA